MHVRLDDRDWERAEILFAHRVRAELAIESAAIGDRTAITKYVQLTGELESIAYAAWLAGAPVDPAPTERSVALSWPFAAGPTPQADFDGAPSEPREVWRSSDPRASRTAATYERFVGQLEQWSSGTADREPPPLCPSGIQNRALTEAYRRFASASPRHVAQRVPVVYIDGSKARAFPLRSVALTDADLENSRTLRFTLLSVRHFSMDAMVDGAWLRNREVSLPRARAETDELVYLATRDQLARLAVEPLTLHLYQTGLAMAVTGFYRGLLDHMLESRAPLSVVPYYFAGLIDGVDCFEKGTPWTSQGQ